MQKGFNSDIQVRGQNYHVQTEDWGSENPFLVSRIFRNGAVLKTIKSSREEALFKGPRNSQDAILQALKRQHHQVLEQLMSGEIR
jgi:hypothetical protein